jgi:DNA-binding MurR/RpiR family transcriptional regulator
MPTWTEMYEYGESQYRRGLDEATFSLTFEHDLIRTRQLEDAVDLIADARFRAYRLLGGTSRTLASYRAEVRANLRAGGDGFGSEAT